jgi:hypothetical protein
VPSATPATRRRTTCPQPLGVRGEERADLVAALGSAGHRSASLLLAACLSSSGAARRPEVPGSRAPVGHESARRIVGHRVWVWFDVNAYASGLCERASEASKVGLLQPREIRCPSGGREFDESDQTNIYELAALIGETLDALRGSAVSPRAMCRQATPGSTAASKTTTAAHATAPFADEAVCAYSLQPQVPLTLPGAPARLRRTGAERSCMTDPNRGLESSANRLRAIPDAGARPTA